MSLTLACTVVRGGFTLRTELRLGAAATGIFGPSGAGKSTLLQLVAGLVRHDSGRVELDGTVLDDAAAGIHLPAHRRRLGVVFQHGLLLPHLDVAANLSYGERLLPAGERRFARAQVVELLELGDLLARRPRQLSGGQRQRVALGRALLCSPRLLLLDEPLSALDRGLKRQILPFLQRVRATCGIPILHVSHDLGELLEVTDELVLLDRGAVVAQGALPAIARDPRALPLLHDCGLVNTLAGTVARHAPGDGLTVVALAGGRELHCPLLDSPPGSAISLTLRPEDIAVAGMAIPDISLSNQLPGRITAITPAPDRVLLTVDLGQPLLVEVSARTVHHQGLTVGATVWVLFKAMALRVR